MLLSLFSVANKDRSKRTPGHFEGELVGFAVFAESVPPLILWPSLPTKSKKIYIIWIKDIFLTKEPSTESITESSQSLAVFYCHSSFFFLPHLKGEHFAGLEPVKCLSVALNGQMSRNYNCPALERTKQKNRSHSLVMTRGNLCNNDDDGSGKGVAKKTWICVLSNFIASIWKNLSNIGDFCWTWILQDLIQLQKEKGKFCPRMFMSSIKRRIRTF